MSQSSTQLCHQCCTPLDPGKRFCSNCGTSAEELGAAPTATPASPLLSLPVTVSSTTPPITTGQSLPPGLAPLPAPPPSFSTPVSVPAGASYANLPSYAMQSNAYAPPPPPPPSDPYSMPQIPYPPAKPAKKRWPMIVLGIILALVLVTCAGSYFALSRLMNTLNLTATPCAGVFCNNSTGGNYTEKVDLSNLTVTYASDEMTFTSLQQAPQFSDDSYTTLTYKGKKNYVRVNFREKQNTSRFSSVYYRSAFFLILPDKTVITPENSAEFSGPQQGVQRSNWIDFGTSAQVDLNNLVLRMGREDEATIEVSLKSGADVNKYQPKTINPNKPFKYATMDWTLKSATQSLYDAGQQAKSGKVFVTISLVANNNSNVKYYLYSSFARLKAGSDVIAPEYSSNTSDFSIIRENTSNLQGTLIFKITAPPDGTYTLQFEPIKDTYQTTTGPTVEFQIA